MFYRNLGFIVHWALILLMLPSSVFCEFDIVFPQTFYQGLHYMFF